MMVKQKGKYHALCTIKKVDDNNFSHNYRFSRNKMNLEKGRCNKAMPYVMTFFVTLLFAKLVVYFINHGSLLERALWASPSAWIAPLGFACISCFAYWYRKRNQ